MLKARRWKILCVLLINITATLIFATENLGFKKLALATLEWPPYTTKQKEGGGPTTILVRNALVRADFTPSIRFFPWARTLRLARTGEADIQGYFPEYYSEELARDFLFSDPIGGGWLVFAERKSQPIEWNTLDDVLAFRVGVVDGYLNTAEIDAAIAKGALQADIASTDAQNLKKLAAGRVSLVVIDENVFHYLLENDPSLSAIASQLQLNAHKIEYKQIYLCLRKSEQNTNAMNAFNGALKVIQESAH